MDKELQNFINQAKGIKMTQNERLTLRAKLSSLPIPSPLTPTQSPYLSHSHFWTLGKVLVAACLIVVLSGGSLSYAAEKSLPGDLLYPVKTEFNEELVSAFQLTPKAKIAWQEKRVGRRLKEIETLTQRHQLSDQARVQIENNLEKHQKKAWELKEESKIDDKQIIEKVEKARAGLKNRESKEDDKEKSKEENLKKGDN